MGAADPPGWRDGGLRCEPVGRVVRSTSESSGCQFDCEIAKCHKATYAPQQSVSLFDNLVGAGKEYRRYIETDCPRCFHVDRQLELGGLQDRKIGRFRTLEDAAHITCSAPQRRFTFAPSVIRPPTSACSRQPYIAGYRCCAAKLGDPSPMQECKSVGEGDDRVAFARRGIHKPLGQVIRASGCQRL